MPSRTFIVDFSSVTYAGSGATVGYTVKDSTGATVVARTTGTTDLGKGLYQVDLSLAEGFRGSIYWDLTSGSNIRAVEDINLPVTPYASGAVVNLNLEQVVGHTQVVDTVGRALQLARSQARGNWIIDPATNSLTLYDTDGTTVVAAFTLAPAGGPYTQRTVTNE